MTTLVDFRQQMSSSKAITPAALKMMTLVHELYQQAAVLRSQDTKQSKIDSNDIKRKIRKMTKSLAVKHLNFVNPKAKRPPSAWNLFVKQQLDDPDFQDENYHENKMRVLADMWLNLSPGNKYEFEQEAANQKKEYLKKLSHSTPTLLNERKKFPTNLEQKEMFYHRRRKRL